MIKPWIVQKIFSSLNFLLCVVLIVSGGFLIKSWISGSSSQELLSDTKVLTDTKSKEISSESQFHFDEPLLSNRSFDPASVPFQFKGTASVGDKFFAIVEYQGKQKLVKNGEKIEGWTVQNILGNSLEVENGSEQVRLERASTTHSDSSKIEKRNLSQASFSDLIKPSPVSEMGKKNLNVNAMKLEFAMVQDMLTHWADVMKGVRFIPYAEEGKSLGYELLDVMPESAIQKLGFRTGDIIEKINGREVTDLSSLMAFYQNLEQGDLKIDLKRGSHQMQLVYLVEGQKERT